MNSADHDNSAAPLRTALAEDELPIIEAAYRLIADPDAFDQFFSAWSVRIKVRHGADVGDCESPQLARSIALVADLFRTMPAEIVEDGIERYVRDQTSPAMVLTLGNQVVATNVAAAERFGAKVGRQVGFEWLQFASVAELDLLRQAARFDGNRQHVILRVGADSHADNELAEARIIRPNVETGPLILVRLLSNPWNKRVADMLRECFALTDAEVDVARALYRTPEPAAIAAERATSLRTVRNQLQQIYGKTWVAGQAELVRLIALLCANAADEASPKAAWTDPLGRERIFQCPKGRNLAYSWMGKKGGYPAILVHGPLTGYVLADEIEAAVKAANIQIFTICRPGFGNSDMGTDNALEEGCEAILALADHLEISNCVGIGLVNGTVPLAEAARRAPHRFNQLLAIGSTYPLEAHHIAAFPRFQRIVVTLAQQKAKSLDVLIAAGLRFAQRFGWEFVLARMAAGVPADRRIVFDPANLPRVIASTSMVIAQGGSAFGNDLSMMFHDFRPALSDQWPLHILAGAEDPVYSLFGIEAMADGRTCTFEVVPNAAQRVYDAAPQQVARAICEAVERSRSRSFTS